MTKQEPVKHAGCSDCGSKTQRILKSVMIPGELMGKALCDDCIKKRKIEV